MDIHDIHHIMSGYPQPTDCSNCDGAGIVRGVMARDHQDWTDADCPECAGAGHKLAAMAECDSCGERLPSDAMHWWRESDSHECEPCFDARKWPLYVSQR